MLGFGFQENKCILCAALSQNGRDGNMVHRNPQTSYSLYYLPEGP